MKPFNRNMAENAAKENHKKVFQKWIEPSNPPKGKKKKNVWISVLFPTLLLDFGQDLWLYFFFLF